MLSTVDRFEKQGGEKDGSTTEIRKHIDHIVSIDQPIIVAIEDLKPFAHFANLRRRQLGQRVPVDMCPPSVDKLRLRGQSDGGRDARAPCWRHRSVAIRTE